MLSDIGLLVVGVLFYWISQQIGFTLFIQYYGVPYLWVNFWLVTITYLQHTHEEIPHYRGEEWTFIRGALATVDRDYGLLNKIFHHIGDTHVAHHMFSTMPHYHAEEATECIKKVLGKFYKSDKTPIFKSLYQTYATCRFVDDEGSIVHWNGPHTNKKKAS
jgi:omega-6 fatty acid desaturase (delta-12 desaturase)